VGPGILSTTEDSEMSLGVDPLSERTIDYAFVIGPVAQSCDRTARALYPEVGSAFLSVRSGAATESYAAFISKKAEVENLINL
jgi:hypothetical protein